MLQRLGGLENANFKELPHFMNSYSWICKLYCKTAVSEMALFSNLKFPCKLFIYIYINFCRLLFINWQIFVQKFGPPKTALSSQEMVPKNNYFVYKTSFAALWMVCKQNWSWKPLIK